MEKNRATISMILLTVLTIAVIAQLTLEQAEYSNFSLAAIIIFIFVLSYLIARLYERYK